MKKRQKPPDMHVLEAGERSEYFEGLLLLQRDNPKAYAVLSPALKIALGRYSENKSKAAEKKLAA